MDYLNKIKTDEVYKMQYEKQIEFPSDVIVDTTAFCNLKCHYCGHPQMTRKKGFMPLSLYKKVVDEIAATNKATNFWTVFYGDPLILRYKIAYLISYAAKKGLIHINLNTNGVLLEKELSEALIDSGLNKIVFSLDAYYENSYKRIRNNPNFEKVKRNIFDFKKVAERLNSDIRIEIQIIEMPRAHRENEINEFENYWNKNGFITKVKPYVTWTGAVEAKADNTIERYPCTWLFKTLVVTWTGVTALCGCDFDLKCPTGNANTQSLKEIWQNKMEKYGKIHLEGRYEDLPVCNNCTDWQSFPSNGFLARRG